MSTEQRSLVVFAPLRVEAAAVRRGLRGGGALVIRTGMGPDRARAAAKSPEHAEARALAVAGVCGAISPDLRPGDIVVATEVRTPDGLAIRCSRWPPR
jgi:4-hydroxy-3-methylbut-2-enyl diphosphate reductase